MLIYRDKIEIVISAKENWGIQNLPYRPTLTQSWTNLDNAFPYCRRSRDARMFPGKACTVVRLSQNDNIGNTRATHTLTSITKDNTTINISSF